MPPATRINRGSESGKLSNNIQTEGIEVLDEIKLFEESIGTEAPKQCNDPKDAQQNIDDQKNTKTSPPPAPESNENIAPHSPESLHTGNSHAKSPLKEHRRGDQPSVKNNENITGDTAEQFRQIMKAISSLEKTVNQRFAEQDAKIQSLESIMNKLMNSSTNVTNV